MPVIGFLSSQSPDGYTERLRAFRQGLKDAGYVEGENVVIAYRWPENEIVRLADLAADLARRPVAVIVAEAGTGALAAKAANTAIPIVFFMAEDPVRLGLVASLARPGGNLTGINFLNAELTAKRLELLRELVPAAARIAVLVNPTSATTKSRCETWRRLRAAWVCKSRSSTLATAGRSTRPSRLSGASDLTPSSSVPIPSSAADACN